MDTYDIYKISFFRAGLFRFSKELIYNIDEGVPSTIVKILHYIQKQERDGEKFDDTKIELIKTFQR